MEGHGSQSNAGTYLGCIVCRRLKKLPQIVFWRKIKAPGAATIVHGNNLNYPWSIVKKPAPENLPSELKSLHFPELAEDEQPTRLQLKEKILELHEEGRESEASALLSWNEKLKSRPQESAFSKASKVTLFVLIVLAGILGVLWLLFGGVGSKSDSLVICVVGGQTLQGDECFSENPGGIMKGSKPEEPKPGGDPIIPGDV